MGGIGVNSSGDLFLTFSTANRGLHHPQDPASPLPVQMLPNEGMTVLFEAVGGSDRRSDRQRLVRRDDDNWDQRARGLALPLDRLVEVLRRYSRLQLPSEGSTPRLGSSQGGGPEPPDSVGPIRILGKGPKKVL